MTVTNSYEDATRAASYARLEFANTYYLAYRDLPALIGRHVTGARALDFGCGTGRSTRFARHLGLHVTGVDIAPEMITMAQELDPSGDYRLIEGDELERWEAGAFDLVLSVFPFDNIAGDVKNNIASEVKPGLLRALARQLRPSGRIVNVVSDPEIYLHGWASFSTKDYPSNRLARSGDTVWCVTTDFADRRPVADVLCTDETYRQLYAATGLEVHEMCQLLATGDEPYQWVNETKIAPWSIYVLGRKDNAP